MRVLLVGRTSNSPEALHFHLKDQSQSLESPSTPIPSPTTPRRSKRAT